VPGATPLTTPPVPTVAMLVLLLLHVPPAEASVRLVVKPTHTLDEPVIAAGVG
jgi:hypothetical protein